MAEPTLACHVCGEQNPADHRCCKQCGARLNAETGALEEQVRTILKRELQDQKVVELELAQAVLERISSWAKLFGYFVAIPLALLIATLAIWGITKFTDFNSKIDAATADVGKKLTAASGKADELGNKSAQLEGQYQRLQEAAAHYEAVGNEVESLRADVSKLQERFGITAGSAVTSQQRAYILDELSKFQRYFQGLGYTAAKGVVKVDVRDKSKMEAGALAYFDLDSKTAVISTEVVGDISMILREYSHSVLYSKTPSPMKYDQRSPYIAMEWGLASFFPAGFLGTPKVTLWNLEAAKQWSPAGAYFENDEPVAEMLWAARNQVADKAGFDRAVLKAWFDVAQQYSDARFPAIFTERLVALLGPVEGAKVKQVLASRGLPI